MLKLGVHNRLGAVTEAMRRGLIAPGVPTTPDERVLSAR
jgi:hypothetical protein